jgi:hypothetical protein
MKKSPLKILDPAVVAGGSAGVIGGIAGIASGIIGSKERRREQELAQSEYDMYRAQLEARDTSNPYLNMQNVYEDLTVNTQAAEFAAQQQAQGQANIMDQFAGAAGGSGIAGLAQAMAQQQAQSAQAAAVDIGQQERQNLMAERSMAGQLQAQEREGELISRKMQQQKTNTLLGMAQGRLGAARAAREQARQAIIGGVGQVAGSLAPGFATIGSLTAKAEN